MTDRPELFDAFLEMVDPQHRAFVCALHELFIQNGCVAEIKPTRSGYLVSCKLIHSRKAIANFVFRKSGLLLRIYADCVSSYEALLDSVPDNMLNAIRKAPDCKRLTMSGGCNPKCAMGYDFIVRGDRFQKCRSNAFLFPVNADNGPHLRALLERELAARRLDDV